MPKDYCSYYYYYVPYVMKHFSPCLTDRSISNIKTSRLIRFGEITAVYSESHTIHTAVKMKRISILTFWRRIFFLNFSTPVFKMWVIQKPNKVALWNKRHFKETKMEIIQHVWNIQYGYLLNKYKMGHLKGNFTPVLYMGRKVPKG